MLQGSWCRLNLNLANKTWLRKLVSLIWGFSGNVYDYACCWLYFFLLTLVLVNGRFNWLWVAGEGVVSGVWTKLYSMSSGISNVRDGSVIVIGPPLSSMNVNWKPLSVIVVSSSVIFASKFKRGFLTTLRTDVLDNSLIRSTRSTPRSQAYLRSLTEKKSFISNYRQLCHFDHEKNEWHIW